MKSVKNSRRPSQGAPRVLSAGVQSLERAEYSKAIGAARKVLGKDPNHLGGLELLARALWRSGDFGPSLDTLRHLIRLNPYEPGYHYMRAVALQSLGHYGEAIRAFGRCVEGRDGPLVETAVASIRELEDWQETVIAELLRNDAQFQREYDTDPVQACNSRGFAFSAEDSSLAMRLAAQPEQTVFDGCRSS